MSTKQGIISQTERSEKKFHNEKFIGVGRSGMRLDSVKWIYFNYLTGYLFIYLFFIRIKLGYEDGLEVG